MKTLMKHLLKAIPLLLTLATVAPAAPIQVTVAPSGSGTLTLSQAGNEQVTITATPMEGYLFSGWSGGAVGSDTPQSLSLAATFTPAQASNSGPGTLAVTSGLLAASGPVGGPFTPATVVYTLRNTGSTTIQWSVSASEPWLSLSASGGSLAAGGVTTMWVTLANAVGGLGTGYYTDSVRFANLSNPQSEIVRPASLIVTDVAGGIAIVTDGDSFSPVLTVDAGARVLWNWGDGTTSSAAAPAKVFASRAVRVNRLAITPWSALKRINLGYDASDGGDPALERVPAQPVIAVAGLEQVAPYLQKWLSSYARIASLNFDNFVNLDTVECFQANYLAQLSLHNTPKLSRLCVEQCNLGELDLSESPSLADLRGAANPLSGINFGGTGTRLWHLCTRDTQFSGNLPPLTQFPQLRELLIWNDNQAGALNAASGQLTLVLASHNQYTSADFSGAFSSGNGWLDVSGNRLTSLKIDRCPGLVTLFAGNNQLGGEAVDYLLETLDSLGRYGGYVDLQGNSPPFSAGHQHAASLKRKGWTVNLASQGAAPPAGTIIFSTENASVEMEVQVKGNPQVTWHWSDGTTDSGLRPEHSFPTAGHRVHYLSVDPASALVYFGAPYGLTQQGISSVSGLAAYPNLSFVYLFRESVSDLDIAGCEPLRDLHLAGNASLPSAVLDKIIQDLDTLGGYGGTLNYPAASATTASAAARARLVQKGWKVNPM